MINPIGKRNLTGEKRMGKNLKGTRKVAHVSRNCAS